MSNLKFSIILFGLRILFFIRSVRYTKFRDRLKEKNFIAQMKTKDNAVGRCFIFENGKIKEDRYYVNGKVNGQWFNYYENGQVKSEGHTILGKKEGKLISFYNNGIIKKEEYWKNGKKTGSWTQYDEYGKLIETEKY